MMYIGNSRKREYILEIYSYLNIFVKQYILIVCTNILLVLL